MYIRVYIYVYPHICTYVCLYVYICLQPSVLCIFCRFQRFIYVPKTTVHISAWQHATNTCIHTKTTIYSLDCKLCLIACIFSVLKLHFTALLLVVCHIFVVVVILNVVFFFQPFVPRIYSSRSSKSSKQQPKHLVAVIITTAATARNKNKLTFSFRLFALLLLLFCCFLTFDDFSRI